MSQQKYLMPASAIKVMDENFRKHNKPIEQCGYEEACLGKNDNYIFSVPGCEKAIDLSLFLNKHLEIRAHFNRQTPSKLLDLGCGEGGVVRQINDKFNGIIEATGITASVPKQPSPSILQRNFEYLFEIDGIKPKSYDFVVAHESFFHTANPALCLIQAYNALKPDGVLLVNRIPFWGFGENDYQTLVDYLNNLQRQGLFRLFLPLHQRVFRDTVIYLSAICLCKRTEEELVLPLNYKESGKLNRFVQYEYEHNHRGNINLRGPQSGSGAALQRMIGFFKNEHTLCKEELSQIKHAEALRSAFI